MSTVPFSFGKKFQRATLSLMLKDVSFATKAVEYIPSEILYSDSLTWLFDQIKKKIELDGTCPSEIELEDALKFEEKHKRKLFEKIIEELLVEDPKDKDFLKKKLTDYSQRIKYNDLFLESQVLYNAGKIQDAFEYTIDGMRDLYSISFEDDAIIAGADLQETREIFMNQIELTGVRYIPTMIRELDDILGGGLEVGRFGLLLAEPKKGKTILLINLGCAGVLRRNVRVAHFVLEGLTEETTMKYESRLSGIAYNKIYRDDLTDSERARLSKVSKLCKERLVIVPMNTKWDFNTGDFDSKLKELEMMGFDPHMVILDYADLMKPRTGQREKRHEQTDVYRDLKSIAMRRKIALWSASQATRPSDAPEKEYLIRGKDVSESYEKTRIVDFLATLNQTPKEKKLGILRLHADLYRNAPCEKTLRLLVDFRKMRAYEPMIGILDTAPWMRRIKRGKR